MSISNFKLIAEVMINEHYRKIESGEIHLNFSSQHDHYVCESALEMLENEDVVERVANLFENADMNNVSAMSLAHALSDFEPEEISRAWID